MAGPTVSLMAHAEQYARRHRRGKGCVTEEEKAVIQYLRWQKGLSYREITLFLNSHGHPISRATVARLCARSTPASPASNPTALPPPPPPGPTPLPHPSMASSTLFGDTTPAPRRLHPKLAEHLADSLDRPPVDAASR